MLPFLARPLLFCQRLNASACGAAARPSGGSDSVRPNARHQTPPPSPLCVSTACQRPFKKRKRGGRFSTRTVSQLEVEHDLTGRAGFRAAVAHARRELAVGETVI